MGENALYSRDWVFWPSSPDGAVTVLPIALGEERLPYSPERPDIITEARVKMNLVEASTPGSVRLVLDFSFPDPRPYGIPFSFQKIRVAWEDSRGPQSAEFDWSNHCRLPGRSLFPGQHWTVGVDLGSPDVIGNPKVLIYGSRN